MTSNVIMMVPCYADGVDGTLNESGWKTGLSNYIKIYTPISSAEVGVSQRHNGTWGNGYRIQGSFIIYDNYFKIDGISVYNYPNYYRTFFCGDTSSSNPVPGPGLIQISNCFAWNQSSGGLRTFDNYNYSGTVTIEYWNCIGLNNSTEAGTPAAFYFNGDYTGSSNNVTVYAYNCTGICPTGYAFASAAVHQATLTNCLGQSGRGFLS